MILSFVAAAGMAYAEEMARSLSSPDSGGLADFMRQQAGDESPVNGIVVAEPIRLPHLDGYQEDETRAFLDDTSPLRQATMLQPTPYRQPRVAVTPEVPLASQTASLGSQLFASGSLDQSLLRQVRQQMNSFRFDVVSGAQAGPLTTTDIGSLLKKSTAAPSTEVQRRTPIVNDPRVRSSRIGTLAASGSYWVAAREDLDTVLSKFDSRLLDSVVVIPGPYSSTYGPGFRFIDFTLLPSPRSECGCEWIGRTSFDHNSNGNQWFGLQSIGRAGENWGMRLDYVHRVGGNYRAGNGTPVSSSYESREWLLSMGRDLRNGDTIELSALRLDQTDVELPGYVFDIDVLVTDGYSVSYLQDDHWLAAGADTEIWYNRTWFEGDAQNPAKRDQFPLLDLISYQGFTDVDSLSTGYRRALGWGESSTYRLTMGHDLRFIKQELNEISSGLPLGGFIPIVDANSPIPRSFSVNPGLFAEYSESFCGDWYFVGGGRVDYVQTDVVDDPEKLQALTFSTTPATMSEILGTDQVQTDRFLWNLFGTLQRRYSDQLVGSVSVGYAERPPTLTELYAVEPYLLVLQNGLNNVTGDPRLDDEKLIQLDVVLDYESETVRAGARGFHGWAFDYITFENMRTLRFGPDNEVQQVDLKYVNTDRVTLTGFEGYLELFPRRWASPFATVRYVDGRDRTRNGDFATRQGQAGMPSIRLEGQPRGAFSFVPGADAEPLPGISPLETRVGFRLNDVVGTPQWNMELSARIVDNQDRVASSLLESPTPGFTVWDLRGNYQPTWADGLLLVSGLENFTNKNYREHLDFRSFNGVSVRQPGINFYFGADWQY